MFLPNREWFVVCVGAQNITITMIAITSILGAPPEADLKWGGHGLSEASWGGGLPGKNFENETKLLISGHFSGYSELDLHCTRICLPARVN